MGKTRQELSFDTVRITAWVYAVCLGVVLPIAGTNAPGAGVADGSSQTLGALIMMFPVAFALWSASRRWRLGYYACFAISMVFLITPGVSCVIGFNMLRALRQNRAAFFPARPVAT